MCTKQELQIKLGLELMKYKKKELNKTHKQHLSHKLKETLSKKMETMQPKLF